MSPKETERTPFLLTSLPRCGKGSGPEGRGRTGWALQKGIRSSHLHHSHHTTTACKAAAPMPSACLSPVSTSPCSLSSRCSGLCSALGVHTRLCWCCCCAVAKTCLTLCDPVDCSTPSFPVFHCLPEFAQGLRTWHTSCFLPGLICLHLPPPTPPSRAPRHPLG